MKQTPQSAALTAPLRGEVLAGGQWPPLRTSLVENVGEHLVCSRGRNAECRIPVAVPGGCPRSFDLRPPPTAAPAAPLLYLPPAAQRLATTVTSFPRNDTDLRYGFK